MRRFPVVVALVAATGLAPRAALAQMNDRSATAQALFDEGLALMNAGKLAEACPKLQKSQELDPGIGTAYRLGECYEKIGRLASAWELFVGVAEAARKSGAAQKADVAQRKADALLPRLSRVVVNVHPATAATPGLAITRDGTELGRPLFGTAIPIDAGEHEIRATAPGKKPFATHIAVPPDAKSISVEVPVLADGPHEAVIAPPPPIDAGTTGRGQRIAGVVLGVAGLGVGAGVGATFGALASSSWDGALGGCVDRDPHKCPAAAQQKSHDAQSQATISTIGFIGGGALFAAGVIVFLTAPSARASTGSAPRLRTWIGASGGGLLAEGTL